MYQNTDFEWVTENQRFVQLQTSETLITRKSKILIIEYKISHSTKLNACLYQSKMQMDLWRIMEFHTINIKYIWSLMLCIWNYSPLFYFLNPLLLLSAGEFQTWQFYMQDISTRGNCFKMYKSEKSPHGKIKQCYLDTFWRKSTGRNQSVWNLWSQKCWILTFLGS